MFHRPVLLHVISKNPCITYWSENSHYRRRPESKLRALSMCTEIFYIDYSSPSCYLFPALKRNLNEDKFKDNYVMDTLVGRQRVTGHGLL